MASHIAFRMVSVLMLIIISTIGLTSGHPNDVKKFGIGESLVNARDDSIVEANPMFNVELVARSDIPTVTVTETECMSATSHLPGTPVTATPPAESTASSIAETASGSQPSMTQSPSSAASSASASSANAASTESVSALSSSSSLTPSESATTAGAPPTEATGSGTAAPSSTLHPNAAHRFHEQAASRIVALVALVMLFAAWIDA